MSQQSITHSWLDVSFHTVYNELAKLSEQFKANKLLLTVSKTNYILFYPGTKQRPSAEYNLKIGPEVITQKMM